MHAAVYSEYLEVHTLSALLCYQLTSVNNGFTYYEFEYIHAAQLEPCIVLVKTHMTLHWSMYKPHD